MPEFWSVSQFDGGERRVNLNPEDLDFEELDIRPLTDDEMEEVVGAGEIGTMRTAPS
ncbi:hypothetical protein ACGFZB_17590 [Streptomyces cinerochromogenes]|uniref:Uncharacterized protein n=1 Tax=Streptomyces cinerochromogenes TaxID=66422 RepID=A0ABW7B816_9ACTN